MSVAKMTKTGLAANTQFYYGVEIDGVLNTTITGKFKTPPTAAGTAASFKFAFSSCANTGSNHVVFDRIRAQNPLFFAHLGDFHYLDIATDNIGRFRGGFETQFSQARQHQLYREIPTIYMFDDHDYGPNDSAASSASRPAALAAYREWVPHPPLVENGVADAVYHSFEIGRCLFIVTDLRSMATHESVTDSPAKTKMGTIQKAWFKALLADPANANKVFVWLSTSPWVPNVQAGEDHWGGYSTERIELADYIKATCPGRLFILSGDTHAVGLDDGSHGDWATGGGGPIREFTASPLDTSTGTWTATYTSGYILNVGQFGIVEVTDTGGSTVDINWVAMKSDGAVLYTMAFTINL
jgi:alkaline phosphatase D